MDTMQASPPLASSRNPMFLSEGMLAAYVFAVVVFSFQSGTAIIAQAIGIFMVVAFLYESLFRIKGFKFILPIPLAFFYAFVIFAFVSLLWSSGGMNITVTLLQLFVSTFVMVNIVHYRQSIAWLKAGYLCALLYTSFDVWRSGDFAGGDGTERVTSFLGNANVLAIALFIGILFLLDSLFKTPDKAKPRILLLIQSGAIVLLLALFSYEVIFLTGSRKGMISVFLVFFMFFLRSFLTATFMKKLLNIAIGGVIITGLYQWLQESVFFKRFLRLFSVLTGESVNEGSLNERASMAMDGLRLWMEKPILGWGTNQFRYISGYDKYAHNNYVELLSNNGIVGFVIYYLMIVALLVLGVKLIRNPDKKRSSQGWFTLTALVVIIVWDFALVSYYSKLHWLLLSILIGMTYNAVPRRASANNISRPAS
jgi:O-antigen ligase